MNLLNVKTIKEQMLSHTGNSVLASRPGLGKTVFSLQLASAFSKFEDIYVVYISLELSLQNIGKRLMTMGLSAENIHILDPLHLSEADILYVISPNKKQS